MRLFAIATAIGLAAVPAANAAVDLIQVPAACGSPGEVLDLLSSRMPSPQPIGRGDSESGAHTVVLFVDSGHWALVARQSADRVCVVASGGSWTSEAPDKDF